MPELPITAVCSPTVKEAQRHGERTQPGHHRLRLAHQRTVHMLLQSGVAAASGNAAAQPVGGVGPDHRTAKQRGDRPAQRQPEEEVHERPFTGERTGQINSTRGRNKSDCRVVRILIAAYWIASNAVGASRRGMGTGRCRHCSSNLRVGYGITSPLLGPRV